MNARKQRGAGSLGANLRRVWPHALAALIIAATGAALIADPAALDLEIDEVDYSKQHNYVIRPGHETEILGMLDLDPDEPGPVPGVGYWAENVEILEDRIRVEYWSTDDRKRTFVIHHPNTVCEACVRSDFVGVLADQDDDDALRLRAWLLGHLGPGFTALWKERLMDLDEGKGAVKGTEVVKPPRWFGRHPAEVWLLVNQVLWVAFGILISWVLLAWIRRGSWERAFLEGAALLGAALGLRVLVATWGPGDLFLNVAEVFWRQPATFYGNAPDGLLIMLLRVLPARIETLVMVTLVLGSLSVVMVRLLAAELVPGDRVFAWAAALILMVQPVLVRFSGEANRQMYVLFFGVTALWAWLRWERRGRALDAAVAGFAATLCVHSRPEAFPILLLLVLATALRVGGRAKPAGSWMVLAAVMAGYAAYYRTIFHTSSMESVYVGNLMTFDRFFLGPEVNLWLDPAFTPAALIVLLVAGLGLGAWQRKRWIAWAAAGLLGLAFIASSMPTGENGGRQLASARYQTLAVLLATLLAAWGFSEIVRFAGPWARRARAGAAAGLVIAVVATGILPFRGVTKPTTLDHEYRLMKQWILELPPRAEVFQPYNYRYNDLGLRGVVHLGRTLGREDVNWFNWPEDWRPSTNPQLFWRQSSCSLAEHVAEIFPDKDQSTHALARVCEEVSEHLEEHQLLSAELPFRVFLNADRDRGTLQVGMYGIPSGMPMPSEWFPGGRVPTAKTPR